jgi:hypothetical protein
MNHFDTQPLLNEINDVIKNGFQEILKDYMKRHWLLEETHDKLVNLPSVKQFYGATSDTLINETKEDVFEKINNLDEKINNMWKIQSDYIVKLSNQLDELKIELVDFKNDKNKKNCNFSNIEKENIKLEIVDDTIDDCKNDKIENKNLEDNEEEVASVETETKEEEEEQDEEEEHEEEDEEEDEEFTEIEIDDITYCTNDEENGIIYELDSDGNVGKKVGYLKEGDAYFD